MPGSGKMENQDTDALTELEGAVLGVIAGAGEITAYGVKEVIAASPSRHWSGSAGAIYPLVKRLEQRGLLAARTAAQGRRKAVLVSLTGAGRTALKAWIADAGRAADAGFDPLRTRISFVAQMADNERAAFLLEMETRLAAEASASPFPGGPEALENRIHHAWMQARLEGFRAVRKELGAV